METTMNYSQFLFAELLRASTIKYKEMEHDSFFEEALMVYDTYSASKFNDNNKSECDCMVQFIEANFDPITK